MSQEKRKVISLMLDKYDIPPSAADTAEILHSESGLMHTIKIKDIIYKALLLEGTWKIDQMK